MRRHQHTLAKWGQEIFLFEDQLTARIISQLIFVGHGEGTCWASFNAETTEDATQVIDLVDLAVTLSW